MAFLYYFAITLFLFVSFLLSLVILVQESQSLGFGASFGGDGGDSLFGTSTADVLKKMTVWLAGIFLGSCIILSLWTSSLGAATKNLDPAALIESMNDSLQP